MYLIQDKECGNQIDVFDSLIDAQNALNNYESEDKDDGSYTPDFYEIVEV